MADARGARSAVATGRTPLAAQRAPLRRAAGTEQGADGRAVRGSTGADLAPQLRYSAAAIEQRRSTPSALRPELSRCGRGGSSGHRIAQGNAGAGAALLGEAAGPGAASGPHGAAGRARQ